MISRILSLLAALLLAVPACAQAPSTARYGNTLWAPGGVLDVRLPVMGTLTANYNPLYTNSTLNSQGTDASTIIPFNCAAGCVTLMPRSTSAVFPPNSFVCFVNEGVGTLTVGTQDTTNSPIEGARLSSNTILLPQYGSVCLRAKANNHYEAIGSVNSPTAYTTYGPGTSIPSSLTNAPTIAVDGSLGNIFPITLTGNSTLGCPANITAGTYEPLTFVFTQDGTGGRTLSFPSSCYKFPSASGPPILTTRAGAIDMMTCLDRQAQGDLLCPGWSADLVGVAPTNWALRTNHVISPITGGGNDALTVTVTFTGSGVSTDTTIVKLGFCGSGGICNTATPSPTTVADNNGHSCTHIANTLSGSGSAYATDMWRCPALTTGTITATWASPGATYQVAAVEQWSGGATSPDAGLANKNFSNSASSLSLSPSASITQLGELLTSFTLVTAASQTAANTVIDTQTGSGLAVLSQYQLTSVATGTPSNSSSFAAGSGATGSIWAGLHN